MKVLKLTSVAVALAALPMLASCADQEESLIIAGAPAWQGSCAVTVPAAVYLARGSLDVRFETEYLVPLEIRNQLTPQSGDSTNSGTDNSEFQISGVDVRISSAQRSDLIDDLESENDAFVDFSPAVPTNSLGGGGTLGYLVTGIPAATASRLSAYRVEEAIEAGEVAATTFAAENPGATEAEILGARRSAENGVLQRVETFTVSLTVRAQRTGNRSGNLGEIEARQFEFPVDICHGCLVSCASCSFDVDLDGDGESETINGECPDAATRSEPTSRLFISDFAGVNVNCPSAQDDIFVPALCAG